MFHQTTCTFYYHFRHTFMMFRKLIKCRINDFYLFALNRLFNIRNFLRSLINQKNNQFHFRIVCRNCFRNLF